jgi:putative iron-dependent peroxidase
LESRGVVGFNDPLIGPTGYVLPATQHDVVIWLAGSGYDAVFDLSRGVVTELAKVATPANEMVGWSYHHDRDLTGFIDGTENPSLIEAISVALVPTGQPGEGGSILLLQQWEHDAVGWERLPVATQEGFIGRRKGDSAELDPLPPASHVARTDQERLGKIFRRNIAYGTLTRHGTIFVGFSRDQGTLRTMLESMLGADGGPPGQAPRRHPPADRRLLRHPIGRSACCLRRRGRGRWLTQGRRFGNALFRPH